MSDEKVPQIDLHEVNSSNVAQIGHDPQTNTLAVLFHSGGLYHYSRVDAEKYERMRKSESMGHFMGAEIKGKHPHKRLNPKE